MQNRVCYRDTPSAVPKEEKMEKTLSVLMAKAKMQNGLYVEVQSKYQSIVLLGDYQVLPPKFQRKKLIFLANILDVHSPTHNH